MNKAAKAALCSGLIGPGAGHFLLKRHVQGTILLAITLLCLGVVIRGVLKSLFAVMEKIESGQIPTDFQAILNLVSATSDASGSSLAGTASYVILACWLIGIVDSYRIGKAEDTADTEKSRPE